MKSKLTLEDARLIIKAVNHREKLKKEYSQLTDRKLAEKFGVVHGTIRSLRTGRTWKSA